MGEDEELLLLLDGLSSLELEEQLQAVEDLGHLGLGGAPGPLELISGRRRRHSALLSSLPQRLCLRSWVVSQSAASVLSDVLNCRAVNDQLVKNLDDGNDADNLERIVDGKDTLTRTADKEKNKFPL